MKVLCHIYICKELNKWTEPVSVALQPDLARRLGHVKVDNLAKRNNSLW